MTIKIVGEPKQQTLILATNEVIESRCVKSCNSLAESAVSPAEKKCYFSFDSGKKCEF